MHIYSAIYLKRTSGVQTSVIKEYRKAFVFMWSGFRQQLIDCQCSFLIRGAMWECVWWCGGGGVGGGTLVTSIVGFQLTSLPFAQPKFLLLLQSILIRKFLMQSF
jgi:hypothetical protein